MRPGPGGKMQKTGWSQSGDLITGNKGLNVKLDADFELGAHGPGTYTVQFGVQLPSGATLFGNQVQADISWSVAGNTIRRRVTVGNGTSVTGVGEAVSVAVTDVTDPAFFPAGNRYTVSISVVRGNRANYAIPPFLVGAKSATPGANNSSPGTYLVAPGTSIDVPIPTDVGIVSAMVVVEDPSIPPTDADLLAATVFAENTALGITGVAWHPKLMPTWVPLTPGLNLLTLANRNGAANIIYTVYFGVDG